MAFPAISCFLEALKSHNESRARGASHCPQLKLWAWESELEQLGVGIASLLSCAVLGCPGVPGLGGKTHAAVPSRAEPGPCFIPSLSLFATSLAGSAGALAEALSHQLIKHRQSRGEA